MGAHRAETPARYRPATANADGGGSSLGGTPAGQEIDQTNGRFARRRSMKETRGWNGPSGSPHIGLVAPRGSSAAPRTPDKRPTVDVVARHLGLARAEDSADGES